MIGCFNNTNSNTRKYYVSHADDSDDNQWIQSCLAYAYSVDKKELLGYTIAYCIRTGTKIF